MLLGAAAAPVFMATRTRVLQVAPGRTETALTANSAAFDAGIAAGALLGGALLPAVGVRGTFLVGGVLTTGALVVLCVPARTDAGGRVGIGRYRTDARS